MKSTINVPERLSGGHLSLGLSLILAVLLIAVFSAVFLVQAQPITGVQAVQQTVAAPDAGQQLGFWAFPDDKIDDTFVDNKPIPADKSSANSQPEMIMHSGDIDHNGKSGQDYTDATGEHFKDGQAAAWNDIASPGSAELIIDLDSTSWMDLAFRFDYQSDQSTGYELEYRTASNAAWTPIGRQKMTADGSSSWHLSQVNLAAIDDIEDQSNLQLRLSQFDLNGAANEFKFDNFEFTGSNIPEAGAPTIEVSGTTTSYLNMVLPQGNNQISATKDDPTDPARTSGIDFQIIDPDADPLDVTVFSDNEDVVPNDDTHLNLSNQGGGVWNLKITPNENNGIGFANIDVTADDGGHSTTYTIKYASSAAADNPDHDPSLAHFHTGLSDASSAIAIDENYMFVANDELILGKDNIYLFDRNHSGYHYYAFDAAAAVNPGGNEMDLEASTFTSSDNTIYWLTSMSNNKDGKCKPDRNRLFATTIVDSGIDASLDYVGRYDHLREDLINWDIAGKHGKTKNYFGLYDSAYCAEAGGIPPKSADKNGFNIEGLALAPSSETKGLLGFRAPITPPGDRQMALVVTLNNMTAILDENGNLPVGSADFGEWIELDLGGRGIRSIERNENDEYLISAGPATETSAWAGPKPFALYTWSGSAADDPVLLDVDLSQINTPGSWESIVEVPTPLNSAPVQLLVDNGTTNWYGDSTESKLWSPNWQKFRSEWVTLSGGSPAPNSIMVTNNNDSGAGSLPQAIDDIAQGGTIKFAPNLNGETIFLNDTLAIEKNMTIDGMDAPRLSISGVDNVQVFYIAGNVTATLSNLTIRDGRSGSSGGGIENDGFLTILNSTITNNRADWGGGIVNLGTMLIKNSTISGNEAIGTDEGSGGGAIDQYGQEAELTILFSTISGNSSPDNGRGGIWLEFGELNISDSVVAGNNDTNCTIEDDGIFNVSGENLDDDGSCDSFTESNVSDPGLGPLAPNGGPTETHALLPGSPAIDKIGDCSGTDKDQRGFARPQGSGCDIGAFELKSENNNTAPEAFDQTISTPKNTLKSITLSAGDLDQDPLTFEIVSQPDHGTLLGSPPTVRYDPDAGYTGPDSFQFKANDGLADSNTATVSISVLESSNGSSTVYLPMITIPQPPIIAQGSNWRYLDNGTDQGSSWRSVAFNDNSWKSGKAQLGYGDGDEATVVTYGSNNQEKYITTYFRQSFNVSNPASYSALYLRLLRDDGAIVYLNNQEVVRSNMPGGSVNYKTLASTAVANAGETTWHNFIIDPSNLISGKNVLAVEIHQIRANSSDISFDLALTGAAGSTTTSSTRFAAIGDYGRNDLAGTEGHVADLVDSWDPDFVITMGDNSYGNNKIDDNIGKYYAQYIGSYSGSYGPGSATNRFFPAIGNHDYTDGAGINAYLAYFTLPPGPGGGERYYDFIRGPVHFFVLDSNPATIAVGDGTKPDSVQGQWLEDALGKSNQPWNIVYFHYAPYSSSDHGSENNSQTMRWPFEAWGASAVLTGHDHIYERFQIGGIPYFVNGIGVLPSRKCDVYNVVPKSEFCHDQEEGAMLIEADQCQMSFKFYTWDNQLKDSKTINQC